MSWNQLQIKADHINAELIGDILLGLDAAAVTLLDAQDQPLLEPAPGETPLWDEAWVSGLFPAEIALETILDQLKLILGEHLEYRIIPLADQNWERVWLEHFKPMQFGNHLWITPEEQKHLIQDPKATIVILDPGLAFGTGTHPTTALCLEWLANHIKPEQTIIDYGCGSGILAITAAKLGAKKVFATDNDPQAITATKENAKRNEIAENILQVVLSGTKTEIIPADILIANILSNILIKLAATLSALVKPHGYLVLSGILHDQIPAVIAAYDPWFQFEAPLQQEDWVCLVGEKFRH